MIYLTAIVLGVLSSFHCIGMCGPIAIAAPVVRGNGWSEFLSRLLYHAGRGTSYLAVGLLAGLAGKGIFVAGYQQALSIGAGILILLWIILPRLNPENWKITQRMPFIKSIRNLMGTLFRRKTYRSAYEIGMLNGLLPCGMVYMALAGATTTGDAWRGGLYMLCFTLGTLPLLFALTSAWKMITVARQQALRKMVPVMLGLMACLMIVRGLNLGIPYLSPYFDRSNNTTMTTCQQDSPH